MRDLRDLRDLLGDLRGDLRDLRGDLRDLRCRLLLYPPPQPSCVQSFGLSSLSI